MVLISNRKLAKSVTKNSFYWCWKAFKWPFDFLALCFDSTALQVRAGLWKI